MIINTKFVDLQIMAWLSGQQLQGGKYLIEQELGEGGFGITYRAKDNNGRLVVIKTLNEQVQRRPDFANFQQDFLNEAIKLARCSHPHIVQIHEVIHEDVLWCMVMEYIDGEDLASLVENQGVLSEAEALSYIQQIGEALIVVHNNGLLHRDIKPPNIMLRAGKSEAVLIDFGIARDFSPNLTQTHTQLLSDGFAPIEQYDKRAKRGAYTDVYALAATLYFVLTGEVPTMSPIRAIGTQLIAPKQINFSISDRLNQAILKGMEVKPENRPQSVQEWLKLLDFNPTIPPLNFDYYKLQNLLANGNWIGADIETSNLLVSIACPKNGRWLDSESIKRIPCEDLRIIDKLWIHYSNGLFGFSVQNLIWKRVKGNVDEFGNSVGWRVNNSWIKYSQFTFSLDASKGHLPSYLEFLGFVWKSGWFGDYWDGDLSRVYALASKLTQCNL
ncbi:serine/threonine-protein kinase [Nodularia spumigena CS-336/02]|uniref:serine/threonine-protein kinase n=2 Tax=Cyanophyceae TaxID=3028117 RepID=UPI00233090F7|nr:MULTISPECIES: serine/threonine-protein kinase [Cyanophyceae]MDB9340312.1 serine/threonine-protein kinase [Nodularia spumigena CS-589/07]MDB9402131.1 serine/threonine-protein kinase [Microcystis aeruginosa CS-567/02-A1]MDB9497272.1 serine/threonine-protein kinase [Nodularia spumigena CS-336/02]MDB9530569.1 serine/threonine-protein kinase [Nodularia spumigena CS-1038]